jgi:antitoxin component YwqK of YwqJK toxin-antitoxin module
MSAEPNANSKRRRRRRWRQLSLRSLLLWMVLVSLAMWWYLRPVPKEIQLLGGLTLRRGVLTERDPNSGEETLINHGLAEIVDERGRVWVRGYFDHDQPSGKWTWFDEQGRQMLRGRYIEGRRIGVWTGLYPSGRRRFEVTYGKALQPVKGELVPYSDEAAAEYRRQSGEAPVVMSWREGPARSWWDNGVLSSDGSFAMNRRSGTWKFWDQDGQLVSQGGYRRGIRHGSWLVKDSSSDGLREAYYIDDVQYAARDALLRTLAGQLRDDNPERRFRALLMIQAMETDGLPALRLALSSPDIGVRRGALSTLMRLGPAAQPLADLAWKLAEKGSPLRFEAMLACLAMEESQSKTTLRGLLALAAEHPGEERVWLLYRLSDLPESVVDDLEDLLDDEDSATRHRAFEALTAMFVAPFFPAGPIPSPRNDRLEAILQRSVNSRDPQVAAAAKAMAKFVSTSLPPGAEGIP